MCIRDSGVAAAEVQRGARRLVERMALVLQGSLLVRHAPQAVAQAFCAGRLGPERGAGFGSLPPGTDVAAILGRSGVGAGGSIQPWSL